jgi:hypothetical protein
VSAELGDTRSFSTTVKACLTGVGLLLLAAVLRPGAAAQRTGPGQPELCGKSAAGAQIVPAPVHAPQAGSTSLNMELVGSLGGTSTAMTASGQWLYFTQGRRLGVADISRPTSPRLAGWSASGAHALADVELDGARAYVAQGAGGVKLFDIRDPAKPVEIATVSTPGHASGLEVASQHVFVADGNHGLTILERQDDTTFSVAGRLDTPRFARGLALRGDHVYVAEGDAFETGLRIIDASDVTSPREIAFLPTAGGAFAVDVLDQFLYLAAGAAGVRIFDLSAPTRPRQVAVADSGYPAYGLALADGVLVVAGGNGVLVFSVSRPHAPRLLGSQQAQRALAATISQGLAYAVDDTGLNAYGLVHAAPVAHLELASLGPLTDVVVADNDVAYLSSLSPGNQPVVDVSVPTAPQQIASSGAEASLGLGLEGGTLYAASRSAGLQIIDVAQPSSPRVLGSLFPSSGAGGFGAAGAVAPAFPYAYLATWSGTLRRIVVSTPRQPRDVGWLELTAPAVAVELRNDVAYVANHTAGLVLADVRPVNRHPRQVSRLGTQLACGVAVAGAYAYVADGPAGLRVVDIRRPEAPVMVSTLTLPGTAVDVAVTGARAYVANLESVRAIDIGDPAAPVEVGFYQAPGTFQAVTVHGGFVYAALVESELLVLRELALLATPTQLAATPTITQTDTPLPATPTPQPTRVPGVRRYIPLSYAP